MSAVKTVYMEFPTVIAGVEYLIIIHNYYSLLNLASESSDQ